MGAIKAMRMKAPHPRCSPFSTTTSPIPPPAGPAYHNHYYYSKRDSPRSAWFWTIAAGALGYCVMSRRDPRCKMERRVDRVFRDVESQHRDLKNDLMRIQLSLEQVRGQSVVHRPSLQEIYLRQQMEAQANRTQ